MREKLIGRPLLKWVQGAEREKPESGRCPKQIVMETEIRDAAGAVGSPDTRARVKTCFYTVESGIIM